MNCNSRSLNLKNCNGMDPINLFLFGWKHKSQPALMLLALILGDPPVMHTTLLLPLSSPSIPFLTAAACCNRSMLGERFSPQPFPSYTARFVWSRAEMDGNWYKWEERNMEGWLCPALFKYFEAAPKEIYVKVSPK